MLYYSYEATNLALPLELALRDFTMLLREISPYPNRFFEKKLLYVVPFFFLALNRDDEAVAFMKHLEDQAEGVLSPETMLHFLNVSSNG